MAGSLAFTRQIAVLHHDLCDSSQRSCQRHAGPGLGPVPLQSPFLGGPRPSMRSTSSHDVSGGQQSLHGCSHSRGAGGYCGSFTIFGIRLASSHKSSKAFTCSLARPRGFSGPGSKGRGGKLQYTKSLAPGMVDQSLKRNAADHFGSTNKITSEKGHRNGRGCVAMSAGVELAGGIDIIGNLGLDSLTFLIATVVVVPAFKAMKASPILGFLISGVVFNQLGLIRNVTDVKALSELGVLFLLFEMGLELSLARLRALAKYALGIGLAQVLVSTLVFTAFELPTNNALGTRLLEFLFHARPDLVNIRTVDEAVVIGAGLSLSSSAFVLQLLAEKGELPTRFGSATLGILLLQDIAVVPLLVILPILESGNLDNEALWPKLAAESLKALLGLGVLSLGGRLLMRRFFEVVANSRSTEAFVALCLLTVTGTSLLTQKLGFSDTLGAFLAGALLAETNYKTQVEADIRPFRGLLLGLFFVTTGTSIDLQLLYREWPNVLALLGGLIAIKTAIISIIGPRVGLTIPESVRTGLLLSQGGEFAFVVFSLANKLGVLPTELNRLLIIVVVLSMALTPLLNEVGRTAASYLETKLEDKPGHSNEGVTNFHAAEPVVIIGFGQVGQVLANFLSTPLVSGLGGAGGGWPYVAFDLDPGLVRSARNLGFPVLYGDGSRPVVLQTAGISSPKAVLVLYTGRQKSVEAVQRMRAAFPTIPIYGRSQDLGHLLELKTAGATDCILETTETSLQLGSLLLRGLGVRSDDVRFLRGLMRESMELRAREAMVQEKGKKEGDFATEDFQAKVRETWTTLPQSERGITWAREEYQGLHSSSWQKDKAPGDSSQQQVLPPAASSRSLTSDSAFGTASSTSSLSSSLSFEKMKQQQEEQNDGVLGFQTSDDELPMRLSSIDSSHLASTPSKESADGVDGSSNSASLSTSDVALTSPGPASPSHGHSHGQDHDQTEQSERQGRGQDEHETTNGSANGGVVSEGSANNGGAVSEAFTVKGSDSGSGSGSREDTPSSSRDGSSDNKSSSSVPSFDQSQTSSSSTGRSDSEETETQTQSSDSGAPDPPGLAILRLKYRDVSTPIGNDDARGVTLCTLPGDSRFQSELEVGEKVDAIDESIKYSRD